MLQQAFQRRATLNLFRKNLQTRSLRTVPGKHYEMPESVDDVVKTLDARRPTFTMLYFSAAWNPMCAKIEKDYENLTVSRPEYTHIKVDCDQTPWVKKYFDARVEPQFIMLVNGAEVKRVIGYNFLKLDQEAQRVVNAHNSNEFDYFGTSGEQWERFYDAFDRYSRYGEHDRDSFRVHYDFNSDQHRGPGTANP